MYWVEWKTRKASPARKSREERRPATGRSRKPVHAVGTGGKHTSSGQSAAAVLRLAAEGKAGEELTLQEAGHVLQLRDVVLLVAAVFLQQGEDAVVLAAGVSRVQGLELPEHSPPRGLLVLRVLHQWDGLAPAARLDHR